MIGQGQLFFPSEKCPWWSCLYMTCQIEAELPDCLRHRSRLRPKVAYLDIRMMVPVTAASLFEAIFRDNLYALTWRCYSSGKHDGSTRLDPASLAKSLIVGFSSFDVILTKTRTLWFFFLNKIATSCSSSRTSSEFLTSAGKKFATAASFKFSGTRQRFAVGRMSWHVIRRLPSVLCARKGRVRHYFGSPLVVRSESRFPGWTTSRCLT